MANVQQAASILVVEDDSALREALVDTLEMAKFSVHQAESAEEALTLLAQYSGYSLIVSDVNMGRLSGHDLLRLVKQDYPHIPVLLITAFASISESVQAMRDGAVDYLVKPFAPDVLISTVKHFIGAGIVDLDEPIAMAESSRQLLQLAKRIAQSDSTALLLGESGTGKEVLARYIHNHSPRAHMPFIAINCAAIPDNMLEAMLFGHEKGAYTGAHSASPGKFEQANGGTLLLDEISEMEMGLQAKLLRVLQEREVERLGGRKNIKLDVRVIATSNRDMHREIAAGKFREDLYFRLSVLPLQWAPLRERVEDIVPLAQALLNRHAIKQHRHAMQLSLSAKQALMAYSWPGNVRELDNVMQRALILQTGSIIEDRDLGLQMYNNVGAKLNTQEFARPYQEQARPQSAADIPVSFSAPRSNNWLAEEEDSENAGLGSDLRQREYEIIVETLKKEHGSKKNTADRLGISPRTLRYKLARLRDEGFCFEQA